MRRRAAPAAYSQADETAFRDDVAREDDQNHKRGRDVEIGKIGRLILTDRISGDRYAVIIDSGVLSVEAVP